MHALPCQPPRSNAVLFCRNTIDIHVNALQQDTQYLGCTEVAKVQGSPRPAVVGRRDQGRDWAGGRETFYMVRAARLPCYVSPTLYVLGRKTLPCARLVTAATL